VDKGGRGEGEGRGGLCGDKHLNGMLGQCIFFITGLGVFVWGGVCERYPGIPMTKILYDRCWWETNV